MHVFGFIYVTSQIVGNKRSSTEYDDEDYDNDPFASKKVVPVTYCLTLVFVENSSIELQYSVDLR